LFVIGEKRSRYPNKPLKYFAKPEQPVSIIRMDTGCSISIKEVKYSMIKIDLARAIADKVLPQITQKEADAFLTAFMDVIGEALEKLRRSMPGYLVSYSLRANYLKHGLQNIFASIMQYFFLFPAILTHFGYSRATPALSFVKNIKKGYQHKV